MLARKDASASTVPAAAMPAIDRIQQMLAGVGTSGSFATRHTAPVDALYFDVVDFGAVPLPLSPRTAAKLCKVAHPARYGLRDQTLLDARVRDTWEIGKRQIKIDTRRWRHALDPKLAMISCVQWTWLAARIDQWVKPPLSSYSMKIIIEASRPIVGLLATAARAGDRDLQSMIVKRLTAERGYPIDAAMAVLRAGAPHGGAVLGLVALHEDCTRTLDKALSAPPRTVGDWSITTQLGCKCELCTRLDRFLRSSSEQQLEWPLAKDRRAHVHGTITSHELPVNHVTRRTGSPYTLVLTKTRALFTAEAAERATWARDLVWLREVTKQFPTSRVLRQKGPS